MDKSANSMITLEANTVVVEGDLTGKTIENIQMEIETIKSKLQHMEQHQNCAIASQANVLNLLKSNDRIRVINNEIYLETRSSFFRSMTLDSRWVTLEYIEKLLENDNIKKAYVFKGLGILMDTTYKNDKKWKEKARDLIKLFSRDSHATVEKSYYNK